MKKYKVNLNKKLSSTEYIEANSAVEAEEIAFERWWKGEILLTDSGIPGDVDITVEEIGG